jgi:predicted AlkP superfamily pyrophosphatase or phosphodiesterase
MVDPILPSFGHGCVTDLLPAFLSIGGDAPLPASFPRSGPRILFVLDGLGWDQLQARPELTPTLSAMAGGPITTVAPSTTATALTSITTGLTPSEHGIVGYRMMVDGHVLNCLRWATGTNHDARSTIPPGVLQPINPFMGEAVTMVTKADFQRSGFSEAHLRGGRFAGYRTPAVLVHEIARQIHDGENLIYAYYDGIDKVAHEYGLGSYYDAEVAFADRLVADLIAAVPSGTTLLVTADHGQVDCDGGLIGIAEEVLDDTAHLSGEGRFRWLHAEPGRAKSLHEAAIAYHGADSWVISIEQMIDEQWFGRTLGEDVRSRLGDVALLPIGPHAFHDPADGGPFELVGRHGSLTSAEMLVPCLTASS